MFAVLLDVVGGSVEDCMIFGRIEEERSKFKVRFKCGLEERSRRAEVDAFLDERGC